MEDNKDANGINNEQSNENVDQYQPQNQMNNQQYNNQQQPQENQYNNQQQSQENQYNNQQQPDNNNGMAIGSLVCGIVSILVNCCTAWFISLPTAIAGIILGIMTIKNNKAGRTMAIIGIVLSSIGALIGIIVLIGCAIVSNNRSIFDQFYREFEMEFDNFNNY